MVKLANTPDSKSGALKSLRVQVPPSAQMNNKTLNPDKELQSYIIGLALGDGNLSNPNGRATRLRITCDKNYPLLIKRIFYSLKLLLPDNKVSIIDREKNYLDISVNSNYLNEIIPWKVCRGSKFIQKATIPDWIKQNNKCKINCLKGLIETDGSIYIDRGYKMIIFTTIIPNLANDFYQMIISLGFTPHIYKINQKNKQNLYHIRLSKNVNEFLDLVKPEKI